MKKITILFTLILLWSAAVAQDRSNKGRGNITIRGPYEMNPFIDNWVVGVGVGVNIYQGNSDAHQSIDKRISTAIDLSVSKWIMPDIGLRLQYAGLDARGSSGIESDYSTTVLEDGFYNEKFSILNLHLDLLWNMSNTISGYRKDRLWNVIPYLGIGWVRSWNKTTHQNDYAASFGILNTIRLNSLIDITIEGRHMVARTRLDRVTCGGKFDGMSSLTVGVSFKIGQRYFERKTTTY